MENSDLYYVRNGTIYVKGTVQGKHYRLSTKLKANPKNLKWISKNALDVLLNLVNEKKEVKKNRLRFSNFARNVLESTSRKRGVETQKDYLSIFDNYILPYFQSFELVDIKAFDIEMWQDSLLKKLSTARVSRCKSVMNIIMRKAMANDIILKNPVEFAESFNISFKKQEPYTIDEMKQIIHHSDGWFKLFMLLAFTTGMRAGELLGLQVKDFSFEYSCIYLKRSQSNGTLKYDTSTKNHNRLIIVPKDVMINFKEYFKTHKNEWVFPSSTGLPYYDASSVNDIYFKPLLKKIKVPYKTMKATRHTYVSLMRNSGVDKNFVCELVGHSDDISDKHYYTMHVTDMKLDAVNNAFDSFELRTNYVQES